MNVKDINTAIVTGTWTNTELQSIVDAVKFARANLGRATKYTLRVGQQVKFESRKAGGVVQGTVDKIAIKYVTVRTVSGLWRVPANMLEAA